MQRVSRAEAARVLHLDRATVTRWVQKHPALLDDAGLVSIDELREHRDTVVNPKLQTRGVEAGPATITAPRSAETGISLNDSRARTESAKADVAELELAERLNLTLRRDDVEAAIGAAAEVLMQAAGQMARDRAEAMTRITDVRAMERALDDLMRDLLTAGSQAMALAVAPPGTARAA